MLRLNTLALRTRLQLAFGSLLLLSVLSSALALKELADIEANLDLVVTQNNVELELSVDMADAVHKVSRQMRTLALLHDDQQIDAEYKKVELSRQDYAKARTALERLVPDEAGRKLRARIDAALQHAQPLNDNFIALARQHRDGDALALLMDQAAPATQALQDALDANTELVKANNLQRHAAAQTDYQDARRLMLGFALASLGAALLLSWLVTRSVLNELGGEPAEVARVAQTIADARLDILVPRRDGDNSSVMAAMARMQQSLSSLVATMRGNAESVATASAQIAQGNQDLSQRTEEQASALQQTAATMDQLGGTVRHNADNAQQANQLASGASDVASRGGQVVSAVVDTMRGINDSSRRIADIIGVIDGIAFQTNILALNAAVEAARAGEQGRGFAVVAAEVRSLAQRSAEAAKEIKSLITSSVEQVEKGTHLVDQAGSTMEEIVASVQRVRDIVAQISAASAEQSGGVTQISQAVTQMDHVTQQNAALVEEGAAAAESLRQQAQQLLEAAAVFQLPPEVTAPRANEATQHSPKLVAAAAIGKIRANAAASSKRTMPAKPARGAAAPSRASSTLTEQQWEAF
ncbi:methyl-accepting chemotaxis protein [Paucibacter sp. APW11]|uniref:Methyl-accepting chemotaxis protein n=1 Tax=Roseateles aquae TaxID=3077235 RepID=A0ABU3P7N6_9BURK|nr:methyl-accepting chemotaxis protein [Paucibacter sp. APW11]MDT8998584.1 methyl-accepting chemotaxis protein [Paucibacter sp. APW11]